MGLDYKRTRNSLQEEVENLKRTRKQTADKLARLDKRIRSLSAASKALARDDGAPTETTTESKPDFDLTAHISELLKASAKELTVPQVRDALISKGWKSGTLAVVRRVLERLVKNEQAESGYDRYGRPTYYDGPSAAARIEEEEKQSAAKQIAEEKRLQACHKIKEVLPRLCYDILCQNPNGVTTEKIRDGLRERNIDMSCFKKSGDGNNAIWSALSTLRQSHGTSWRLQTTEVKREDSHRINIYKLVPGQARKAQGQS